MYFYKFRSSHTIICYKQQKCKNQTNDASTGGFNGPGGERSYEISQCQWQPLHWSDIGLHVFHSLHQIIYLICFLTLATLSNFYRKSFNLFFQNSSMILFKLEHCFRWITVWWWKDCCYIRFKCFFTKKKKRKNNKKKQTN